MFARKIPRIVGDLGRITRAIAVLIQKSAFQLWRIRGLVRLDAVLLGVLVVGRSMLAMLPILLVILVREEGVVYQITCV